jgi:hypothetical protein
VSGPPIDRDAQEQAARLLQQFHEDPDGPPLPCLPPDVPPPAFVSSPRDTALLSLPGLTTAAGLRPADVAAGIGKRLSNTYKLLRSHHESGLLEQVPLSNPPRWRLATARRASIDAFVRLAAQLRPGEWTTCGDISLAHRGDLAADALVCWAAAQLAEFPAPHRVLLAGGRPHPHGHEHPRSRPGTIYPQLLEEGVRIDGFGRAERACRVTWDELRLRAR